MKERVTKGQPSESQRQGQEEEILDIADLLEDVPELPETESEFQTDEDSIDLDQVFNELDEEDAEDEIVDLVDLADEDEPNKAPVGTDSWETIETEQEDEDLDDLSFDDLDLEGPPLEDSSLEEPDIEVDLDEDFISAFELEELLGDSPKSQDDIGSSEDPPENRRGEDTGFVDALDLDLLPESDETLPSEDGKPARTGSLAIASKAFLAADEDEGPAAAHAVPAFEIGEAQLNAAVERVIRKIYAEKIESILVEAIEKTVRKEIDRLKALINLGASDL